MEIKGIDKIDRDEAFRYMGFRGKKPSESYLALADRCESELLSAAEPRCVFRVFDISKAPAGIALDGSSLILTGQSVRRLLKDSEQAAVMAVTLGSAVDELIRRNEAEDITLGFITDMMASAMVEQVCDITEEEILKRLSGEKKLTARFSCGYGDLPLSLQPNFLDSLNAQKLIGVCCTDTCIMTPRKSVTAVAGIIERQQKDEF